MCAANAKGSGERSQLGNGIVGFADLTLGAAVEEVLQLTWQPAPAGSGAFATRPRSMKAP